MAYTTGTVSTLNDLYDAIVAFIENNGWVSVENITTRDEIWKSTGTDGKKSLVYRLTASSEAAYPVLAPQRPEKFFPSIIVRGYQRWASGVGYREFGQVGPRYIYGDAGSGYTSDAYWQFAGDPQIDSVPVSGEQQVLWTSKYDGSPNDGTLTNAAQLFYDGVRHTVAHHRVNGATTPVKVCDLFLGQFSNYDGAVASNHYVNGPVIVQNATTGNTEVYHLANTATQAQQFWKADLDGRGMTSLAGPWATSPDGAVLVWNGADYIYALRGNGSGDFSRYTISTDTWSAMTAIGANRAANFDLNPCNAVYVPNSVTGIGQDVIYVPILNSGTTIYRYDVTDNAWRSTGGTGALTCPFTITARTGIQWDGRKHLYVWDANTATTYYTSDLTSAPGTFTQNVTIGADQTTASWSGQALQNGYAGVLRGSNTVTYTYWLFGDEDSISLVTKVGTKYFWTTFGAYHSRYRSGTMLTTNSETAGSHVTVEVDTSAQYAAGERVFIYDPGAAVSEWTFIVDVPDATSVVLGSLANNYGAGSIIGVDPAQQGIAGVSGFVSCLFDGVGYRTKPNAGLYYAHPVDYDLWTHVENAGEEGEAFVYGNPRQYLQACEMSIYNPESAYGGGYLLATSETARLPTLETLGSLKGVYALPAVGAPGPQAGNIIETGNGRYLVIGVPYPMDRMAKKYMLAFGPVT